MNTRQLTIYFFSSSMSILEKQVSIKDHSTDLSVEERKLIFRVKNLWKNIQQSSAETRLKAKSS
jgi:hypothetical protein